MATKTAKKELKVKHFQLPEHLCDFVNANNIKIVAIVGFDKSNAVYYYEN